MTRAGRPPRMAAGLVAGVVGLTCGAFFAHALPGCYSAVPNDGLVDAGPPPKSDVHIPDGGGESGFVGPGPLCSMSNMPGQVPPSTCTLGTSSVSCTAGSASCMVASSGCGDSLCQPMANNTGTTLNFRMTALHIVQPPALSGGLIQNAVITPAVTPNAAQCGNPASTGCAPNCPVGAFNWLLQIDKKTNKLTTGGAPPVADPYKDSYCFVNSNISGTQIQPETLDITFKGNTFSSTPLKNILNVPIFQYNTPPFTGTRTPIILPLQATRLSDVTISPDNNCIGDLNPEWYAAAGATCADQVPNCPKWFTNGALAGYITLAEADMVTVAVLSESLCVLLTGSAGQGSPIKKCLPGDLTKGDYCSTGGSCTDSFWLSATFAAAATNIAASGPSPCK